MSLLCLFRRQRFSPLRSYAAFAATLLRDFSCLLILRYCRYVFISFITRHADYFDRLPPDADMLPTLFDATRRALITLLMPLIFAPLLPFRHCRLRHCYFADFAFSYARCFTLIFAAMPYILLSFQIRAAAAMLVSPLIRH